MLFLNMLKDLIFRVLLSEELKQHFPFDLDIAKEDEILAAKKTSHLSAMNNSSIKTVSSDKLPVKMKLNQAAI